MILSPYTQYVGMFANRTPKLVDKLEGIDIAAEFVLIQQKKSTLSAAKRRMVVARVTAAMALAEQRKNKPEGEDAIRGEHTSTGGEEPCRD